MFLFAIWVKVERYSTFKTCLTLQEQLRDLDRYLLPEWEF